MADEPRLPLQLPTRAESVRFAIASTEMAGLTVGAEMRLILDKWASGEISTENLLAEAKALRAPGGV